MDKKEIIQKTKKMLQCDSARIRSFEDKHFMIIGYKKHTKDEPGQWVNEKNESVDFEYLDEKVIASGKNMDELWFDILLYNERLKSQINNLKINKDIIEALADYAHEAWSGWMRYLFSKCDFSLPSTLSAIENGSAIIPKWAVGRWTRQMNTPYNRLPENEKESDRREARKMINIIIEELKKSKIYQNKKTLDIA